MRRPPLRRVGLMLLAVVVTTLGMTTPAHAADTGTISGKITYKNQPVEAAFVYASTETGAGGYAVTDANGDYQILNLQPDVYRVQVSAAGHPTQYAPATIGYYDAAMHAVSAGANTVVDDALVPIGTISGRLVNNIGGGMANAMIATHDPETEEHSGGSASTDAQGYYSMVVPEGTHVVSFTIGNSRQYVPGARDFADAQAVAVAADQTVTVNETARPNGSAAGTVLDAAGQRVGYGLEIIFAGTEDNPEYVYTSAYTDENGDYRLDGLPPGPYRAMFRLDSGSIMLYPHTLVESAAQTVTIAENAVTDVDDQLLGTGTVKGRFTIGDEGAAGVEAIARPVGGYGAAWTNADEDGYYQIDEVFTGSYTVSFRDLEGTFEQWATGKLTEETANVFPVAAGGTTTVNDSLLPTGTVKIKAKDSTTGAAVKGFTAGVYNGYGQAEGDTLTLTGIPVGTHPISLSAAGYASVDGQVSATVGAGGQTVTVMVSLTRVRALTGTIVDRVTGAAVRDVCVIAVRATRFSLPDGCGDSTDENGNYRITYLPESGPVKIFVAPYEEAVHGAQWVGATGGTGDQRQAVTVTPAAQGWTTGPAIRMDRRAPLKGTVTSETGQPITWGSVGMYTPHPGLGGGFGDVQLDEDGKYATSFFGPYSWPLVFSAIDHAMQWSGGKPDRFSATPVKLTAGTPTTYDYNMKVGRRISGTITMPEGAEDLTDHYLVAGDVTTNDYVAVTSVRAGGRYTLRVLGPVQMTVGLEGPWPTYQAVKFTGKLTVGRRDQLVNFCVTSPTTMVICGSKAAIDVPLQPTPPARPVPGTMPTQPVLPGGGGPQPR
ncbi:hypothetical protein CS0771_11390 [Catellatospora sp. IY07-71]|uniref:carboxypeptidase regulatory-like domain-containing protein n=1 Tax=Catellatospora sp. IY07-71 TaxID=2728827 RepID=UPI001BB3F9E3|nr:carboxypeptidase regulatory-like domain-containing protein [Catellatospora sp. IY07-71]BCJ71595.1 hypothetical protein CS0771_11390 [Catellatospora sp. IY07-71]